MLSLLIIILVFLGAAVVSSIYTNFLIFYSNFSESESYHKAYYASISALERAELVTRQRQPGYVGSGGFIFGTGLGRNDGGSDKSLSGFSYFGSNSNEASVFRTINSRTTRIPNVGKGDVETMLAGTGSENYNMMNYEDAEVFLLYYDDDSTNNPYNSGGIHISQSNLNQITGEIRLPKLLRDSGFGELDTQKTLVGGVTDSIPNDDAIVDRQIRGECIYNATYTPECNNTPFTIYSTPDTSESTVNYDKDSVFRENDINGDLKFKFGNSRDPLTKNNRANSAHVTIISQVANTIKNFSSFNGIFQSRYTNNNQLRFSLGNLLQGTGYHYYPFLEYYVDFGTNVPDKYFTINAEGNFKDYQVNTIIQKPTVKESILGNFTSIF